jgi:cell cycle arrest protein BUB3
MAVSNYNVAVGTADKRIQIYDIRKFDKPFYDKIQTNCSQIRSLCFMKDDESLAVGTTSSRVLIEYITTKKTPYSFICHKKSVEGVSVFYPINTLAVNPKYNTLATGGSDATASIWDIDSQKRVSCLQLVTSISSMCFSEDGYKLAIACSYNRDNGVRENDNYHKIIIRNSTENELKLK